jgi:hypothetical protein
VRRISQQVRAIAGSASQASQKASRESTKVVGVRSQVVQVSNQQRDGEVKVEQGGQLMQLTQLLAHVQKEVQHCENVTTGGYLTFSSAPLPRCRWRLMAFLWNM